MGGGGALTRTERALFDDAFRKYDDDGSGLIDEDELSQLLTEKAGVKPSGPSGAFKHP